MIDKNVEALSTCHLVFELLHDGEGNIHRELEPISTHALADALRRRHGCDFGVNAELWAKWFLASADISTQDERESIATALRIRKIEMDALRKLDDEDQGE